MCTTVAISQNKTTILGFNYDFYYGHGLIVTNRHGFKKTSIPVSESMLPITWISTYGSITFNQFGVEMPMAGMNERGLSIAMMYHEDGKFCSSSLAKMNELQWIQYQLDNFATVDEVIDNLKEFVPHEDVYTLHYSVCDSSGNTAIIEFIDRETIVIKNPQYHILTNTSYAKSIQYAEENINKDSEKLKESITSLNRFTIGYRNLKKWSDSNTEALTKVLAVLSENAINPTEKSNWNWKSKKDATTITYWSIAFDSCNKKIIYYNNTNKEKREIIYSNFDFSSNAPMKVIDIENAFSGNISEYFKNYSQRDNERIISLSYKPMEALINKEIQKQLIAYPETFVTE